MYLDMILFCLNVITRKVKESQGICLHIDLLMDLQIVELFRGIEFDMFLLNYLHKNGLDRLKDIILLSYVRIIEVRSYKFVHK